MFLSRESQQSARVLGYVLNFPLYDGECSPAARELLAVGNIAGAIAEWRRLADLGSGRARCVLAYLALKGTQSMPPDLEEARRLATSALSGERGYANYVLGCIALNEKQVASVAQYLGESYRAGFMPAATLLASLTLESRQLSEKAKSGAVNLLQLASAAGHRPAQVILCRSYLRGRVGLAKRFLGMCLFPFAMTRLVLSLKYRAFSVNSFYYSNRSGSIFAEAKRTETSADRFFVSALSLTHVAAGILAAAVLITQLNSSSIGWIALAMWPYGLSYLVAAKVYARSWVATAVQTLLLILLTSLTCSAYLGQLFDLPINIWTICILTVVQAALLLIACRLAATAALIVEKAPVPGPAYRKPIAMADMLLGIVAAGAIAARPEFQHVEFLGPHSFEIASDILLTLLPYVGVALFTWRFARTNLVRPWVFLCIIVIGTAMAVINDVGLGAIQPGYLGVPFMVYVQLFFFGAVAGWALEGNEL
jgi:TPR repeat protein